MPPPFSKFIKHHNKVFRQKASIQKMKLESSEESTVSYLLYRQFPEPGCTTMVTYAFSESERPPGMHAHEFILSIDSTHSDWISSALHASTLLHQNGRVEMGSFITLSKPIAPDTEMNTLYAAPPPFMSDKQTFLELNNGSVRLFGLYPLYEQETYLLQRFGCQKLLDLDSYDCFNPMRDSVTEQDFYRQRA